jgi:Ankyrin repeats (3 copies)
MPLSSRNPFFPALVLCALMGLSLGTSSARAAHGMSPEQANDYLAGLDAEDEICHAKYPELKEAFARAKASNWDEPTRLWAEGLRAAPTFAARLAAARTRLVKEKVRVEGECLDFYKLSDTLKEGDKAKLRHASNGDLKTFKSTLAELRYLEQGNSWYYGFMIELADKGPSSAKMLTALMEKVAPLRQGVKINANLVANLTPWPCQDCRGRDDVQARAMVRVATFVAVLQGVGIKTIPGGNTSKSARDELLELVFARLENVYPSKDPAEDQADLERQMSGDPKLLFANSLSRADLRAALKGTHPDPRGLNAQRVNLLFYALDDEKYADLALKLIQSGLDVTWKTKEHSVTALMLAAGNSSPEVLRSLIKMGLPLNALSSDGSSALSYANAAARPDKAKILLDAGADPKFK